MSKNKSDQNAHEEQVFMMFLGYQWPRVVTRRKLP